MPSIGDSLELTPKDLNKFNKKMTDEILQAQKDGWRGHVNRQGHVSMLAPDGKDTVVVSANHNAVNQLLLGINRYRRRIGETVEDPQPKEKVSQKWPCARPTCPKVYATEQHLNDHIAVDHEKKLLCPEPGCHETRDSNQKLSIHRTHAHGYVSPNKAQRKKQEANRKAKAKTQEVVDQVVVEVLEGKRPNGYVENELTEEGTDEEEDIALLMAGGLDEEEAREFLQGASESTGRDGLKFDPEIHLSVDLEQIQDMDIRTVARVLNAAGLKLNLSAERKTSAG